MAENLDELLKNSITAVQDEIDAIRTSKGIRKILAVKGRFVSKEADKFIYSFRTEEDLRAPSDSPVKVIIPDISKEAEYEAWVISSGQDYATLALQENFGKRISKALIINRLDYIWELVKRRLLELQSYSHRLVLLRQALGQNIVEIRSEKPKTKLVDNKGFQPNKSQIEAISKAIGSDVLFIWGPPGTGKSFTIGFIVQELLNRGMRVLITSHTNVAVDNALENVAELPAQRGLIDNNAIVRVGASENKNIENFLLDKIKVKVSEQLQKDKERLEGLISKAEEEIKKLRITIEYGQSFLELSSLQERMRQKVEIVKVQEQGLKNKLHELNQEAKLFITEIEKIDSESGIRKFLLSFKRRRLERQIESLETKIQTTKELLTRKQLRLKRFGKRLDEISGEIMSLGFKKEDQKKINSELLEKLRGLSNQYQSGIETAKASIIQLDERLRNISKEILNNARLVATTLTKVCIAPEMRNQEFDAVIIDEVSASPPPTCLVAMSTARQKAILVGDDRQLPPISIADTRVAKQYLQKDLFVISDALGAQNPKKVPLREQRRMPPKLVSILNKYIYNDAPLNTPPEVVEEKEQDEQKAPFEGNCLIFIDTSEANPWTILPEEGSRCNFYTAELILKLLNSVILKDRKDLEIGIISPYAKQAQLISHLVNGRYKEEEREKLTVSTVHRFQGEQRDIIILDLTDGQPKKPYFLSEEWEAKKQETEIKKGERTKVSRLLNVALSRTKKKAILIANKEYYDRFLGEREIVRKIINEFYKKGVSLDASTILPLFTGKPINLFSLPYEGDTFSQHSLFDEETFYEQFKKDIFGAKSSIVIFSPFITNKRTLQLIPYFREAKHRNKSLEIIVYTRPPERYELDKNEAVSQLIKLGCDFRERQNMHEKLVFIDNDVVYYGSLNVLSHSLSSETMIKFTGENIANVLKKFLNVDITYSLSREEKIEPPPANLVFTKEEARKELRKLRWKIAEQKHIPAFAVLYNNTIDEILEKRPKSEEELLAMKEFEKNSTNIAGFEGDVLQIVKRIGSN